MSCERCGSPSQGALCAMCELMDRVERNHEHLTIDDDEEEVNDDA